MNPIPPVTRDVVRDLLPVFAAGEASADTRALVQAWLDADAALARESDALRAALSVLAATPRTTPRPEAERAAVERVRRRLRGRAWLTALAIFLTALPFTFGYTPRGLEYLMLRDHPAAAVAAAVAAAACWTVLWRRGRPAVRE